MSEKIEVKDKILALMDRAGRSNNASEAMQFAQAAFNAAKAAETLMETLNRFGVRTASDVTRAVAAGDMTPNEGRAKMGLPPISSSEEERSKTWDDLIVERMEIERLALEWGDRWLAFNPKGGFHGLRPMTFDRTEVPESDFAHGQEEAQAARARLGLPPLPQGAFLWRVSRDPKESVTST